MCFDDLKSMLVMLKRFFRCGGVNYLIKNPFVSNHTEN